MKWLDTGWIKFATNEAAGFGRGEPARQGRSFNHARMLSISACPQGTCAAFAHSGATFARLRPLFRGKTRQAKAGAPAFRAWHGSCIRMEAVMNMNATRHVKEHKNMTILNYPGFQTLPKGVRQMLLVSEAYFFNEPASRHIEQTVASTRANRGSTDIMGILLLPMKMEVDVAA